MIITQLLNISDLSISNAVYFLHISFVESTPMHDSSITREPSGQLQEELIITQELYVSSRHSSAVAAITHLPTLSNRFICHLLLGLLWTNHKQSMPSLARNWQILSPVILFLGCISDQPFETAQGAFGLESRGHQHGGPPINR